MRNYDELTDNLLKRRDYYVVEQKKKKTLVINVVTSMCCLCFVALLGFGVWHGGMVEIAPDTSGGSIIINNSDNDNSLQQTTDSDGETVNNSNNLEQSGKTTNSKEICIQEIGELPSISEKMFIALMTDDFIPMTDEEVIEYYGINIFPTVPIDIESKDNQRLGIYKRKTSGEIYFDGNKIQYSNEDSSRGLAVNVDKNCLPFVFCDLFVDNQTRSIVNGIEVGIAQTPIGEMYAEFMYQNVGFRICACGLTQNEFVEVIASIIK